MTKHIFFCLTVTNCVFQRAFFICLCTQLIYNYLLCYIVIWTINMYSYSFFIWIARAILPNWSKSFRIPISPDYHILKYNNVLNCYCCIVMASSYWNWNLGRNQQKKMHFYWDIFYKSYNVLKYCLDCRKRGVFISIEFIFIKFCWSSAMCLFKSFYLAHNLTCVGAFVGGDMGKYDIRRVYNINANRL